MVLLLAIKDHASDIHFEPFEDEFKIRIKADGVLYEMVPPPRHLAFAITTRIKVMANLDIAERRLPQDGRIELDRRRPPGRPARQRAARRCSARAWSCGCSTARSSRSTWTRSAWTPDTLDAVPRGDHEAQRHRAGHRPDRLRQDDHALLGPQRAERDRRQADHDRGPGRVRHRRHHPGARSTPRSA